MKFHALAYCADPSQRVGLIRVPGGKQARRNVGKLLSMREIPVDDGIVSRITEKAKTFAAIVGDTMCRGQICGRHPDPQDLRRRRDCRQWRNSHGTDSRKQATPGKHGPSPLHWPRRIQQRASGAD
jgi:hypothetical protein